MKFGKEKGKRHGSKTRILFSMALFALAWNVSSSTTFAAPAPPITSFEIITVSSPQGGVESKVAASALVTTNDHGGTYIDVTVRQMGYSTYNIGTMDTYGMTLTDTKYVLNSSRAIIGYDYTFRISKGFSSGTVTLKAGSINTGKVWTDSIRIK